MIGVTLKKNLLNTIENNYDYLRLYDCEISNGHTHTAYFRTSDPKYIYETMLEFYIRYEYGFDLPSHDESYFGNIGKETKYKYLVYKRVDNRKLGFQTYGDVRFVFEIPKSVDIDDKKIIKIINKIDKTFDYIYDISKIIEKFKCKLSGLHKSKYIKEIIEYINNGEFNKADTMIKNIQNEGYINTFDLNILEPYKILYKTPFHKIAFNPYENGFVYSLIFNIIKEYYISKPEYDIWNVCMFFSK